MAEFLHSSDAFVWSIEGDPRLRSTIVTLILLDGTPDWTEVANRFALLTTNVPTFRQRVMTSALPSVPPRWEFDPDFDLHFHLRRVSAPAQGTVDDLLEMARIAAMADFDRARPLWEVTLIDGLSDGGTALLCKVHHALTDGVGAVEIARTLFDLTDRYEKCALPEAFSPTTRSRLESVSDEISHEVGLVAGAVRALPAAIVGGIRHPLRTMADTNSTALSMYRTIAPIDGPGSPIMINRSMSRRLAVHEVTKEALRRAGAAVGGTLNDAFIAAVVGGVCGYHQKHGVALGDLVVTMPISIRSADDPVGGNRATLVRFGVPEGVADPASRARLIHERSTGARKEKSLAYTQLIAGALNLAPSWYVSSVLRNVDIVASDVPGFSIPVFLAGAAVRKQYAFSPTIGAAVNVTLVSYVDTCAFGINVDTVAVPDFEVFYDCLVAGFDDVLALGS